MTITTPNTEKPTLPFWTYERMLLVLLAASMVLSCIGAPYPREMYLQHSPTVFMLFFLPCFQKRFAISRTAFTCLVIFMLIHTLGARYIYSYVPYDDWGQRLFGFRPGDHFHFRRNHYDRFVHFCFGLLWTLPVWEVLTQRVRLSGRAARYFAVEFIMAASMFYELFEWGLTMVLAPDDANAYNGQQGDMWDAQKDMALAMVGSVVAAVVIAIRKKRTP